MEELLNQARLSSAHLAISSVNWGEVVYVLLRKFKPDAAAELSRRLRVLPIEVIPVTEAEATDAAVFKHRYGIPYADAFAGSLALHRQATLVTADYDLECSGSEVEIEMLPPKRK